MSVLFIYSNSLSLAAGKGFQALDNIQTRDAPWRLAAVVVIGSRLDGLS